MSSLNHIGLTVRDLQKSIDFYRDVIGMTVVSQRPPHLMPEWYDTLTENHGSVLAAARLTIGDLQFQLLQYVEPIVAPAAVAHPAPGSAHLCINVVDVDSRRQAALAAGYHCSPLVHAEQHGFYSFYVTDPDGLPIELLESESPAAGSGRGEP